MLHDFHLVPLCTGHFKLTVKQFKGMRNGVVLQLLKVLLPLNNDVGKVDNFKKIHPGKQI